MLVISSEQSWSGSKSLLNWVYKHLNLLIIGPWKRGSVSDIGLPKSVLSSEIAKIPHRTERIVFWEPCIGISPFLDKNIATSAANIAYRIFKNCWYPVSQIRPSRALSLINRLPSNYLFHEKYLSSFFSVQHTMLDCGWFICIRK